MRNYAFLVLVPILSPIGAFAAETSIPELKAQTFFSGVIKGNINKAYDELFQGSHLLTQKPDSVDVVKEQTAKLRPLYGEAIGFELMEEAKMGKSVVRLVYLLKLEHHPIIWEFYFYKPADHWVVANIKFNDQFQLP